MTPVAELYPVTVPAILKLFWLVLLPLRAIKTFLLGTYDSPVPIVRVVAPVAIVKLVVLVLLFAAGVGKAI
jgi:hypothetical protein